MLNQVMIQGNLTADPELQKTRTGVSVVTVGIVCVRDFYRPNRQNADYIRLTFWGEQADRVCANYQKGDRIAVVGRLVDTPRVTEEGRRYHMYNIRVMQIMNPEMFDPNHKDDDEEAIENFGED